MATINSRNESTNFIKQLGDSYVHKPSGSTEDITIQIEDVSSNKIFEVFANENGTNLVGSFSVVFKTNDGVYLNLSNISGVKLHGDVDFKNSVEIITNGEEKLIDWADLKSDTIINTILKVA